MMGWIRHIAAVVTVVGVLLALATARRYVNYRIQPAFRPIIMTPDDSDDDPVLEIQCCSQIEEITFLRISGTATNVSDEPLKNVIAHATYLDREGRQVASAQSLLDVPTLMPYRSSLFAITTPVNPAIARISVDFRFPGGPQIPAKFLSQSERNQRGEKRGHRSRRPNQKSTPEETPETAARDPNS